MINGSHVKSRCPPKKGNNFHRLIWSCIFPRSVITDQLSPLYQNKPGYSGTQGCCFFGVDAIPVEWSNCTLFFGAFLHIRSLITKPNLTAAQSCIYPSPAKTVHFICWRGSLAPSGMRSPCPVWHPRILLIAFIFGHYLGVASTWGGINAF